MEAKGIRWRDAVVLAKDRGKWKENENAETKAPTKAAKESESPESYEAPKTEEKLT